MAKIDFFVLSSVWCLLSLFGEAKQLCPAGFSCSKAMRGTSSARTLNDELILVPCPQGTFSALGQEDCLPCQPGFYTNTSGSAECLVCPAGHMCAQADKDPSPCPLGTHSSCTGKICCTACPSGTYTPRTGSTQCFNCPVGVRCPASLNNSCDISLLHGVQLNFNPHLLSNSWSQCYSGSYSLSMNSPLLLTVFNTCNKEKLMLGCRPRGNPLLTVAAMGLRADVLYNCGQSTNCTKVANGVGWYFSNNYSWGFVKNTDPVQRNSCDTRTGNSDYRLCWHTSGSSGYRCGSAIDSSGSTYERVIYHSN